MNTPTSLLESVGNWMRRSVTLKLATILILLLIMLIPTSMIESIISERESLSQQAIDEVSDKWADAQQISGPVLTIPCEYEHIDKDQNVTTYTKDLHILPEHLNVTGNIVPEKLKRGIYEIVVYRSNLEISGKFATLPMPEASELKRIHYDAAFLTIGINDLRGIKDEVEFLWNNQQLKIEPGSRYIDLSRSGINIPMKGQLSDSSQSATFACKLNLHGSQNFSVLPMGNSTEVTLTSDWPSPSFNGEFLPDQREVNENGFKAQWKVLELNRNLPPYWMGKLEGNLIQESGFGVDLLLPVDDYKKALRSSKYAVMTLALTFLIFFLAEILQGRKIHPFQYTLVGLALTLFYILLISISEHTNFNVAYFIATVVIVSLISLYSLSVFKSRKSTTFLTFTLVGIYGFLFTTLQLTDYSLLMGSLGLTAILAATMYLTRGINWYKTEKIDPSIQDVE